MIFLFGRCNLFHKVCFICWNILLINIKISKCLSYGLYLINLQCNFLIINSSLTASLSIFILVRCCNSSHSTANLYFGKYKSILYFDTEYCSIYSSPENAVVIYVIVSNSIQLYFNLWTSILIHFIILSSIFLRVLHIILHNP
jgi:hypothetical protein